MALEVYQEIKMTVNNIKTKLVNVELFDGTPKGFRQVEFETEIIKAVVVPRAQAGEIASHINEQTMAVYLLIGEDDARKIKAYVGQTKRTQPRAQEHRKKRDWWNEIIYFINRAGNGFSAVELDYLEWLLVKKLSEAKRVILDNSNKASKEEPVATSGKKASFIAYYNQIVMLTELLGLDIFNKVYSTTSTEIRFFCKNSKGANASAFLRDDGFYVQPNSECVLQLTASGKKSSYIQPTRQRLLEENVLKNDGPKLIFAQEYKFKTPSGASDIILGTPSNGWINWKDATGKTLDEHFRTEE